MVKHGSCIRQATKVLSQSKTGVVGTFSRPAPQMLSQVQLQSFQPFSSNTCSRHMNRMDNNRVDNDDSSFLSLLSSQRSLLMQIRHENNDPQQATPTSHEQLMLNYRRNLAMHLNPGLSGNASSIMNPNPTMPQHTGFPSMYHYQNAHFFQSASRYPPDSQAYSYHTEPSNDFSLEPTPLLMRNYQAQHQHRRTSTSSFSAGAGFYANLMPSHHRFEQLTPTNEQTYDSVDELTRIRASSPFEMSNSNLPDSLEDIFKSRDQTTQKDDDQKPAAAQRRRKSTTEANDKESSTESSEPFIDVKELRKFADVLEKSVRSQQEIQKWDRKMGLKRSHSKTMTMSMQSRKKLKNLITKMAEQQRNS